MQTTSPLPEAGSRIPPASLSPHEAELPSIDSLPNSARVHKKNALNLCYLHSIDSYLSFFRLSSLSVSIISRALHYALSLICNCVCMCVCVPLLPLAPPPFKPPSDILTSISAQDYNPSLEAEKPRSTLAMLNDFLENAYKLQDR